MQEILLRAPRLARPNSGLRGGTGGERIALMVKPEAIQKLRDIAKSVPVGTRFTENELMGEYGFRDLQELREALAQAQRENLFLQAPLNYVIQKP